MLLRKAEFFSALSLFVEVQTSFYLTSDVGVVSRTEACFELGDILNERFRSRVCSKKTLGFTSDKPFSNPW